MIGISHFVCKRGQRYGILIYELKRRCIIDFLRQSAAGACGLPDLLRRIFAV
jgi:hypothetical protein